jgi:hypothetical protein
VPLPLPLDGVMMIQSAAVVADHEQVAALVVTETFAVRPAPTAATAVGVTEMVHEHATWLTT